MNAIDTRYSCPVSGLGGGAFLIIPPQHASIMEPQIYEQINNQILRLLLYFGGVVITTLSGALAYLWHQWRAEQRERIELDKANAQAMTAVANQLDNVKDALNELRHSTKQ